MLYKALSKLYLAGEYAILKPKGIAVILPIQKYTYLELTKSKKEEIISNIKDELALLENARNLAFEFANKRETFRYEYKTDLYNGDKKLGLGSSASVVVVTIKAILEELNISYTKDDLFKLSVKAMIKSGQKGSMGDVACIVYEKLIEYQSIDKDSFCYNVREVVPKNLLEIEFIHTNIVSKTHKQIENIDIESEAFKKFYNLSNKYTKEYIKAIEESDDVLLKNSIKNLRENLLFLEQNTGVKIYNEKINEIIESNENAKVSGAGLGDYVVSVKINKNGKAYVIKFRS